MDGDDYTYDAPTLAQRVAASQAHMAHNLASVDTLPFDQRVTAQLARIETEQFRQAERINHLEQWVHKLLNPQGGDSEQ